MNQSRRKILHILAEEKSKKVEVKPVELPKPAKQIAVELPKVEVPIEEVKVQPVKEVVLEEVTEVVEDESSEQTEVKRNLPPKQKKYKKDVEVGQ